MALKAAGQLNDKQLVSTVATNLLGPVRLTSALIHQLKKQRWHSCLWP
jgi:uncharacterized oxidoreductase